MNHQFDEGAPEADAGGKLVPDDAGDADRGSDRVGIDRPPVTATFAVCPPAWSSIACSVVTRGATPRDTSIGSPVRMPRTSGNCSAILMRKTLSPTSVWRANPSRTGRSGGAPFSTSGKLSFSWTLAILLLVGLPSAFFAGMWQSWQD